MAINDNTKLIATTALTLQSNIIFFHGIYTKQKAPLKEL
jgi:hypothetical protein